MREPPHREKALSRTCIPARAGFRDYGAVLRQSQCHRVSVQKPPDEFVVCCHPCHPKWKLARILNLVLRPRFFATAAAFA